MQNNSDDFNLAEKINDFVQRRRRSIFILLSLIILSVAGSIVYFTLQDVFHKRAIAEIEELNKRFTDIRFMLNDEYFEDQDIDEDANSLLEELNAFAIKNKGFPSAKAWAIIGEIHSSRKEWQLCEDAWVNASQKGKKTYLGPIALFNAAAAAEEQGRYEEAIEYLEKCVNHKFEFPSAPRAQFNIGRMHENLEDYDAAIEAYREVLIKWQDMPVWQHLARSAIIALEVK